nr:PAS domain-containing protein [Candidatus Desulfobia pelagia]
FHGLPEEALPAEQWAEYYDLYLPDGKTTLSKEEVPLYRALSGEKVTDAELMIIPKEGQLRTLIANGQPLHDSGGKIVGAVVTMHDISGVKLATEELRHSHDLMRYIIEHTRSAIAVHDRDLKYIYVSQSYLDDYKLKEQDIIGKHHYDVFPDLPQKWRDVHKKALAGEVSSAEADPYEREDGSVEWTRWECRPWYEADGAVGGIIVYTEVITEHKKAEDELKQYRDHLEELILERTLDVEETQNALLNLLDDMNIAKEQLEAANERLQGLDRMKSMFVASMSHELRTPLNSIIGFSSILLEGWDGEINEVQEDNIRRILRSGKHLLSLINDVIDVSKIEAGTIAFNLEEFDFQEVCREAESMVQAEIEGKGLDFRMEVEQVSMRTDRRRLFQVVLNLLTNAIKFTGKGAVRLKGRVTDREHIAEELAHHFPAGVQGQFLEVTVEDSGIGIEQQDFVKLFKPFSRLHDSGRSRYPGTGLGLYLTQKLVQEILQGAITFTSISGKGSTFMFAIPCRLTENEN